MDKIGSEFLEDFEVENERFLFFQSKRMLVLWLGFVLGVTVTIAVILLELPDIIFYLFDFVVVLPLLFYGVSGDVKYQLKEKLYFLALETLRTYQTELDNNRGGDY